MEFIIICDLCKHEIEVLYSEINEHEIIRQSKCKCNIRPKLINDMKSLDWAMEVLNAKNKSGTRKVSRKS